MTPVLTAFYSARFKVHSYWSMQECPQIIFQYVNNTTFCLPIHRSVDIWILSTFWLLRVILLWIFLSESLCGHIFSFFLGIHLSMILLGQMIILHVSFWENTRLFFKVAMLFYIPTNIYGFQFLHTLTNTWCALLFFT
jgi:hypothetical protein